MMVSPVEYTVMERAALDRMIEQVPAGAWCVGVSGGADSVALLRLLVGRADVRLVVGHLDHQTRGEASAGDARFVEELAVELGLECVVGRREEYEGGLVDRPANRSALYRTCRLAFFRRVVAEHDLHGVILAHHRDDQAETVFHRLLRGSGEAGGSGFEGMTGMGFETWLEGLRVLRPLLKTPAESLREYLRGIGQAWREDASNQSDQYARNRHRRLLKRHSELSDALVAMAGDFEQLTAWREGNAPVFVQEELSIRELLRWGRMLGGAGLRGWLLRNGVELGNADRGVIERVWQMAEDAAGPSRVQIPGGWTISRRGGVLKIKRST